MALVLLRLRGATLQGGGEGTGWGIRMRVGCLELIPCGGEGLMTARDDCWGSLFLAEEWRTERLLRRLRGATLQGGREAGTGWGSGRGWGSWGWGWGGRG